MKRKPSLILAAAAAIGSIAYVVLALKQERSHPVPYPSSCPKSTATTFFLSEPERDALSILAEQGDANAAFRLAQFHSFVTFDEPEQLRWLFVSASAGHAIAQHQLAYTLFMATPPDLEQALQWAERSKAAGNSDAQMLIEEIRRAKAREQ